MAGRSSGALGSLSPRGALAFVLAAAVLARLPLAFIEFATHHDEVWQYIEPAYHLGFGRWIVVWEYREGARGWMIPVLLAAPVWLGERLFGATAWPMVPLRLMLLALSLLPVWTAFALGRRVSPLHALAAGLTMAIGFEPILQSGRAMSEAIGAAFLAGAALLLLPGGQGGGRRWAVGGVCVGLAFASRLQMAPALGVLVLLCAGTDGRKWLWLLAGGATALAFAGLCDIANGQPPFYWMLANYRLNLVSHISERYGVAPPGWYLTETLAYCGPTFPVLAALVAIGSRRQPILLIVALVHVLVHALIPHKEFRFLYPAIMLCLILAGLGAGDLLAWAADRRPPWRWTVPAALVLVAAIAGAVGARTAVREHRFGLMREIALWRDLHARPAMCGVAAYRPASLTEIPLTAHSYIDRPVGVYLLTEAGAPSALPRVSHAFNMIEADASAAPDLTPLGYRLDHCFAPAIGAGLATNVRSTCLFVRPGGCTAAGAERFLENKVRERIGL